MRDDEDYTPDVTGPTGIVKIIVFAIIGIVVISTLAIPVLTHLGEKTVTYTNTGVYLTDVCDKYANIIESYDQGTARISWDNNGIFLNGEVSGSPATNKLMDIKGFNNEYPIVIVHPGIGYYNTIVTYSKTTSKYTEFISGEGSIQQTYGSCPISIGDKAYIQDSKGNLVLSKDGLYCTDPTQIIGFGYEYDPATGNSRYIWADGTDATTIIDE